MSAFSWSWLPGLKGAKRRKEEAFDVSGCRETVILRHDDLALREEGRRHVDRIWKLDAGRGRNPAASTNV